MYWFLYDTNENIKEAQIVDVTEWTNLNGHAGVVGFDVSNTDAQNAFNSPIDYKVINGALVHSPYVPTLTDVKSSKIAELKAGLTATLAGGFTSKTTGHTYKTDTDGQSNMHADIKRFELDATLASLMFYTTNNGWVSHTHTDLQNAFLDGGKWKDAQYVQFNTLFAQVNSATDVATVQTINWTPATY